MRVPPDERVTPTATQHARLPQWSAYASSSVRADRAAEQLPAKLAPQLEKVSVSRLHRVGTDARTSPTWVGTDRHADRPLRRTTHNARFAVDG